MSRGLNIKLSWYEILHAAYAGVSRSVSGMKDGRSLEPGRNGERFGQDCIGAIGEFAVSKVLGMHWSPAVGFLDTGIGDVGGVQVKSTSRGNGSLILRLNDEDRFRFVLCRMPSLPLVEIAGWIQGHAGKDPQYWRETDAARGIHQAAFFVPQIALVSIDDWK